MPEPRRTAGSTSIAARALAFLMISLSAHASLAGQEGKIDLTGRWCATTYCGDGTTPSATETAEIMIVKTGSDVEVRTSHGSRWSGTYETASRLLIAKYTRNQFTGQVVLWLQAGDDRLDGQWINHSGGEGRYTAYRKRADTCEEEALS